MTVMVALPEPLGAGVNVRLPVVSGLVYLTVGLGMRLGLLEVALTERVCSSLVAPEEIP